MKKKKERKRMGRPFVGEVKNAFGLENNVADELALLVIEREKQKVLTRAKYR